MTIHTIREVQQPPQLKELPKQLDLIDGKLSQGTGKLSEMFGETLDPTAQKTEINFMPPSNTVTYYNTLRQADFSHSGSLTPPKIDFKLPEIHLELAGTASLLDSVKESKVGFFTAVSYPKTQKGHGFKAKAVGMFDDYFFLGGSKANVIATPTGKEAFCEKVKTTQPWYLVALKVISYMTLVIPAVMLVGKLIARSRVDYKTQEIVFNEDKSGKNKAEKKEIEKDVEQPKIEEEILIDGQHVDDSDSDSEEEEEILFDGQPIDHSDTDDNLIIGDLFDDE
jgi:hypothetical protein